MKYKIGDRVKVKSLEWYNANKDKNGNIYCDDDMVCFTSGMSNFCGCILTIKNIDKDLDAYKVEENSYCWIDDMIVGLAGEKTTRLRITGIMFPNEKYADKVELCLGNDYEIVVEDGRTFVQKKKPKYPKTYEECCGVLEITYDYPDIRMVSNKEYNLYSRFIELIRCRDAYWKIAGNELRLNEPWKYDMSKDEFNSAIIYLHGLVQANEVRHKNHILVFPTKEMRDAFYDNFENLIENCKELL